MAEIKAKGGPPEKGAALSPENPPSKETQPEESEEWVFTLNSKTGELLKVERLDKASGERKELSEEEYSIMYGYDPNSEAAAYSYYDPYGYLTAYYQGIADYEAAVNTAVASPEEEAYYQGMSDYGAALSGAGATAEEAAYYQGIADYQAALA